MKNLNKSKTLDEKIDKQIQEIRKLKDKIKDSCASKKIENLKTSRT